jgi:hypothetical protein
MARVRAPTSTRCCCNAAYGHARLPGPNGLRLASITGRPTNAEQIATDVAPTGVDAFALPYMEIQGARVR